MRTWVEGVLAVAVVVSLGAALFMFTGESLGSGSIDTTEPIAFDPEAAARGETLAVDTGCLACHTTDGTTSVGSTWKGLAGSSRPLASGETVTADDAYLTNSIVDPASQIVAGFENVMPPDYGEKLTADEVADIVAYINSLG
jgi:cytochrome c oxidase subunit 2